MRTDIRFAGLTLRWSHQYAKSYSDKLHEMGFAAKVMYDTDTAIVAYSHRPFSRLEAEDVLKNLEGTNDKTSEA